MERIRTAGVLSVAISLPLVLTTALPAQAAADGSCAKAGISTLTSLGLLQAAARSEVDYSTLADPTTGPIFTSLPAGSYLSLGEVVRLHTKSPQLFAWCR